MLDRFRKNDGGYDVVVPGSGGKDSAYTSHILKYKYGMNPLTVTWAPHKYTDIGFKNFENWLHIGGQYNILFTPNGRLHRHLTKLAFENLASISAIYRWTTNNRPTNSQAIWYTTCNVR